MTLLCLPGDGPKLGLGPAMFLPRAKAPNGGSLGPTRQGEVPPGSGKLGPCGHKETGSCHIRLTSTTRVWKRVLWSPLLECQP